MTATKNQRLGTRILNLARNFPTLTSIIELTDRSHKFSAFRGLDEWRACSGMAHSNAQSSEAESAARGERNGDTSYSRPANLVMMLQPVRQYLLGSLELAERQMGELHRDLRQIG